MLRAPPVLLVLAVLALAALIRLRTLGDVASHVDEQFYLLMGDRMLSEGVVPYREIWDRKPVGLFLLYAAIRALGGAGIEQYQLVATAVAGATAAMIALWVNRAAGVLAAVLAALLYLLILQTHMGFGGQAEVFVNLLLLGAGWIVHATLVGPAGGAILWRGVFAMVLVGAAIQIKQTAFFPGVWLGLTLLWVAWRRGMPVSRIAAHALAWILAALLPTLLVVGWYAWAGLLDTWWFANMLSILQKGTTGEAAELARMIGVTLRLGAAFAVAAAILVPGAIKRPGDSQSATVLFLFGWLASGLVAYFAVTAAYLHYAMITAPMGCLLVGYAAGRRRYGWIILVGVTLLSGRLFHNDLKRIERHRFVAPQIEAMADSIKPELRGGCLYVHQGRPVLYMLTDSCLPTRFPFPSHLGTAPEATGLGVDAELEVRRILAAQPPVIVTGAFNYSVPNQVTRGLVNEAIARDYEPLAFLRDEKGEVFNAAYRLKRR